MLGAGWTVLKALFEVIPVIVFAVRDGQIKDGTMTEISNAVLLAAKNRADTAIAARDKPDDGLSDDGMDRSKD